MPKVSLTEDESRARAIIRYCIDYKGWDPNRVEKELGWCRQTRRNRMESPKTMNLRELRLILKGVPLTPGQADSVPGQITWDRSGDIYGTKK